MTPLQECTAEYMFGLIGYSTWNIYHERTCIAQVTLNPDDNLVVIVTEPKHAQVAAAFADRSFTWWMKWLRRHQHEPF